MSDMLESGMAFLAQQLKQHASQLVTYIRGYDQVDVYATFGRKLLKLQDLDFGVRMQWTDMDFLILADDLQFGGEKILPMRGDLVVTQVDGKVKTFEVLPYDSDPPWRWSDPFQKMMRIHTKLVNIQESIR